MPFCYKHPDYWHVIEKETKRTGDMINSRKLFDDSETGSSNYRRRNDQD